MRCVSGENGDLSELSFLPSQLNQSSDLDDVTMGTSNDDVTSLPSDETDIISISQKEEAIDDFLPSTKDNTDPKIATVSDDLDEMRKSDTTRPSTENGVSQTDLGVSTLASCCLLSIEEVSPVNGDTPSVSKSETEIEQTSTGSASNPIDSHAHGENQPSAVATFSLSTKSSNEVNNEDKFSGLNPASSLTFSQSKLSNSQSSAYSSASSVCVSESESESSQASTVRNLFSSGSSLSTVPDEVPSSNSTPDVTETSNDAVETSDDTDVVKTSNDDDAAKTSNDDDVIKTSQDSNQADGSQDSEGSSLCSFGDDSICSSSANDLYTEEDAKKGRKRDRRYSADMSSADSDDHLSASQHRLPTSRSRTGTPEHLRPEAFFLPKDMLKASENRPVLPERYRHALRKSGSYGSLRSHGNNGSSCQGNDEDLTSREKDLGSALAWIRHEMMQMKKQDEVLRKRFIELRASILQLRCMYDVLGSTSDLSSMDGSSVSLNEGRKTARMRHLVRTESDAMMSGGMFKATSSLSLPCSPLLSRLRWNRDDLI